jgi:PKD repeat protein
MGNKMKCRKDLSAKKLISGDEGAVAELIGALLLTAVIAVVIGMLALVVFSGTSAVETPALRVSTVDGYGNIDLIHQGGDTLSRDNTQILVDGVDRTDDFETPEGDPWSTFSVGDILESSIPCTEGTVIQIISTDSQNPTVIESLTCGPGIPPPVANFTFTPDSGYAPLEVSFEDLSTGDPTSWFWDFGDNTSSTLKNPIHTYYNSSTYPVTLTACNEGGCSSITINVTVFGFSDYVTNESVFVYGNQISYAGNGIAGTGSTVVITGGDLTTDDLNGGASISVSNIYINGSVDLERGGVDLGSETDSGLIYITGDLYLAGGHKVYGDTYVEGDVDLGTVYIYGDLYTNGNFNFRTGDLYGEGHVNGDFTIASAGIHDNIYVDGDLTLDWTSRIDDDAYIYYTGSISYPNNYHQYILDKCIHVSSVPEFSMPEFVNIPIPSVNSNEWYDIHGYVSGGDLANGTKIYASNYEITAQWYYTAEDIIIVAGDGDISLYNFWGIPVTGVLFAPNGKVTFSGSSFEGVVIAKDGFYVTSGGTYVEFRNIAEYISDPDDYPFEN